MNTTLLGINTSTSNFSLNNDLIEKLKSAEEISLTSPIDKKIERITDSISILNSVSSKMKSLLSLTEQKNIDFSATSSGTSVSYSAYDENLLKASSLSFEVSSLAKKDVFQSIKFNDSKATFSAGTIQVKNQEIDTTNKSYEDIKNELNQIEGVDASIEKISSNEYRLIVKSQNTGIENKLEINNSSFENIQEASNLNMKIDNVEYSLNENTTKINGLSITANEIGKTTINITKDNQGTKDSFKKIIDSYNDLSSFINNNVLLNTEFKGDKSVYRDTLKTLKELFFKNDLFANGLNLDKEGIISESAEIPIDKINNLTKDLSDKIKEMTSTGGSLKGFIDYEEKRKEALNKERETALNKLNKKYETLSNQFVAYNGIISSYESSFSGLKQMIQAQYANN